MSRGYVIPLELYLQPQVHEKMEMETKVAYVYLDFF